MRIAVIVTLSQRLEGTMPTAATLGRQDIGTIYREVSVFGDGTCRACGCKCPGLFKAASDGGDFGGHRL